MRHFISGNLVACDTETTGLNLWHGDAPFAFSFCNEEGETAYFEWSVDPKTRRVIPDKEELEQLQYFFSDDRITKVFFNAKFDIRAMERGHGIGVCGPGGPCISGGEFHEVKFAARSVNSRESNYRLKDLAKKYADFENTDESSLKKCVQRLRRKAAKEDWNISYEIKTNTSGEETKKAHVEADYWIPRTAYLLGKDWVTKEESELCREYAVKDAERTMLLWLFYRDRMEKTGVLQSYKRELRVFEPVYNMENRGVTVHVGRLRKAAKEAKEILVSSYKEFETKYAWKGVNLRSPVQVAKALFDKNKVPLAKPRKIRGKWTKPRSTSIEDLSRHASLPVVSTLLRYKTCEKGLSSFYSKYEKIGLPAGDGFISLHANFDQVGTDTMRFSCSNPNLQQVSSPESSRHGAVLAVREPFGPRDGYWWLASDYDGQEIRLYAEVSEEPNMLKAIAEGRDIHSMIISRVCGGEGNRIALRSAVQALGLDGRQVSLNAETKQTLQDLGVKSGKLYDQGSQTKIASAWLSKFAWNIEKAEASIGKKNTRGRMKQCTFGKAYGARARTLAETLQEPVEEAEHIMSVYDEEFPGMDEFMAESIRRVKVDGYITTLWGRRLQVDPMRAYTVVNYIIQGNAAELIKHSMLNLYDWFKRERYDASLLMLIHDEIISEIPTAICTLGFILQYSRLMEDNGGNLKYKIPSKPLLITESWHRPSKIRGYPYAS